jgi:hypothetical protein
VLGCGRQSARRIDGTQRNDTELWQHTISRDLARSQDRKNQTKMTADHLTGLEAFEAGLWKIADDLRANSGLASNEYFMPIMGLLFLRQATNRYYAALAAIEADQKAGKMPDREPVAGDFTRRRALLLPRAARFDEILRTPKNESIGAALTRAMETVEHGFQPLAGQLPKDYERFEDALLERMMRTFDSEALRQASGDVFGRIYEYFLMKFADAGRAGQRRVLHAAVDRADHRQRHRAEPRHGPRPGLRLRRDVRAVQPLHRGRTGRTLRRRSPSTGKRRTQRPIRLALR